MKMFQTTFVILLILLVAGVSTAKQLDYAYGILLISFHDDLELAINDNGFVKTGNPEMDRLFSRFESKGFDKFFGKMIIKDPEFRYLTRNDYRIFFPEETDMELVASEFEQIKGIEWVYPDYLIPVSYIPNDPSFNSQWWLQTLDAESAWDLERGSSEILVAAIDTGIDWMHPDLYDNIWVNPGEDIDGDPRPSGDDFPEMPGTLGDWNYVDDDGNGLVDDFIGWDWVTVSQNQVEDGEDGTPADRDPADFNGHGTGCNAAMAEVGNNELGAVGIAFDCQIMSLRAGYTGRNADGQGFTQTSAGVSALVYATEMGADIINLSYGGGGAYAPMRNAVNFAWENNMLLFGAAGNDNSSAIQYPANYEHVIAVGATDAHDDRANFSNWGDWVNIASPGVGCLTAWFNAGSPNPHGYTTWDGTSVATPIAAGVGALVMHRYSDLTNEDWRMIIENTTDPIETDRYIGTGRVNAYKAITQYYWPEITIDEINITDPDGNGHPDLGETIEITLSISSEEGWMDAEFVYANLEFNVDGLQVNEGNVLLSGILPAGQGADNFNTPLSFTVPNDFPDGIFVDMYVSVTCQPNDYRIAHREKMVVGTPELLLVDDDGGDNLEEFIKDDLAQQPFMYYHHHDVEALEAEIDEEYLSGYSTVIWMTGDVVNPFSDNEIAAISNAMDNGTNFIIFGQTIDEQLTGTDFYTNYLHAEHVDIAGNQMGLTSPIDVQSPPITPSTTLILQGVGGANNNNDADAIQPVGGAQVAYQYIQRTEAGGIFYEGDYKLVYFPFAFESVSGQAASISRAEVLFGFDDHVGIMEWMNVNGVDDDSEIEAAIPMEFAIESAYPNPFNSSTGIQIALPADAEVSLKVYDLLGREVATIADQAMNAGRHLLRWDASRNSAGVYFAVLKANGHRSIHKLAYIK